MEIFFEMDILRKLIFMLMSIHKYKVFDASKPEEIPNFDVTLLVHSFAFTFRSEDAVQIIFNLITVLASHVVSPSPS